MPSKSQSKATAKSKSKTKNQAAKTHSTAPLPQWPRLQPLVPTADLSLETLLEDQIVVIRNLFTAALCKSYVSYLSTLPLVTTPAQAKDGDAVRVNDRIQFDDPSFAEQLWKATSLESLVKDIPDAEFGQDKLSFQRSKALWGGDVVGLNPRIRIYRYKEGQFFAQHYDESDIVSLPTNPPTPARTTWTLLIYLTGPATGCVGGETVFYPEGGQAKKSSGKQSERGLPVVVGLDLGMALLHKHGQECLLHEGRKVTKGEKWVIRSDLCVRR